VPQGPPRRRAGKHNEPQEPQGPPRRPAGKHNEPQGPQSGSRRQARKHSEPQGRGVAWTEERATKERATREGGASRSAPEASQEAQPSAPGRDRDAAGRPRNARPRDELGRPLPRDAGGEPPPPDEPALAPEAALAEAQRLIDSGRAFRAHEVLEASWKAAPAAERDLWQGLAQVAVGLTHAQRGNARGAAALLRRGGQRVAGYAGSPPHGIDAAALARFAADLADRIEHDGVAAAAAAAPRPRLLAET
jgi:uncharacterized protein